MSTRYDGTVIFGGPVVFTNETTIPAGTDIPLGAMEEVQFTGACAQSGPAAAATVVLHECRGATGRTIEVRAGAIAKAVGNSTVTIDVKKNGTTILSAAIQLNSTDTNYVSKGGTITVPAMAVGDVLTAEITPSAGTGTLPSGVWVKAVGEEGPVA